jgi:hypothetical protein
MSPAAHRVSSLMTFFQPWKWNIFKTEPHPDGLEGVSNDSENIQNVLS